MREPAYVGAYWGERGESVDRCARHAAACLESLAAVSPLLRSWKPKGGRGSRPMDSPIDVSRLEHELSLGVNRRDIGGEPISELGWSWSAWNGVSSAAVGLSITCGVSTSSGGVLNSIVLDLPDPFSSRGAELYIPTVCLRVLSAVVDAWSPYFGVVTSHDLRSGRNVKTSPTAGWMTYVAADPQSLGTIQGAGIEQFGDGSVVVLRKDWIRVSPFDVEVVTAELAKAGLLHPIV